MFALNTVKYKDNSAFSVYSDCFISAKEEDLLIFVCLLPPPN